MTLMRHDIIASVHEGTKMCITISVLKQNQSAFACHQVRLSLHVMSVIT